MTTRALLSISWCALTIVVACGRAAQPVFALATTTSVQNSGLLDQLLPRFERSSGLRVRVHAAGSGRALEMLRDGTVDAVISHAPETEQRLMPQHPEWSYRKIGYNWFVIVGPRSDPAGVRVARDAADAFGRIVSARAAFVSRGDESGTHERENLFWRAADRRPASEHLIVSGRGMAQALRHADEVAGYTLTDAPTFWQVGGELDLEILFDRDSRLLNTYAVVHRTDRSEASAFAGWLASPAARAAMIEFRVNGNRGFEPWPASCPSRAPSDQPCFSSSRGR